MAKTPKKGKQPANPPAPIPPAEPSAAVDEENASEEPPAAQQVPPAASSNEQEEEKEVEKPPPPTATQLKAAKKKLDALPTKCAYERPPASDDPFPLRTHCIWTEKPSVESIVQGYTPPWKVCSKQGCKAMFHAPCCATTSVSHGLTGVTYDSNKMFCPEHNKDMQQAHAKQNIMLKHMTLQRQQHLDKIASSKQDGGQDEGAALETAKLRVLGLISDMELRNLLTSIPVNEGGFAQRNVASQQASQVEQSMRENQYNILAGNLAVVEIPYTDEEIKELKAAQIVPQDFVAPQRLVDMEEGKGVKDGSWYIDFKDPKYQMNLRRFAIIDGNNRIIALVRITAEDAGFLSNTSLNAYLVDINIHDGLAVQLASMKCNALSHSFIEDTIGDRIFQFQCVIDIFKKTQSKANQNKVGNKGENLNFKSICNWIEKNAKDLVDLLPRDVQQTGGKEHNFKQHALAGYVRMAALATKPLVKWLQQRHALHQSGVQPLTPGEAKVFTYHWIKMDAVIKDNDPISVLKQKARQVDGALSLTANVKSWAPERRAMYQQYIFYEAQALTCSKHVMSATPILCDQMEAHLTALKAKHMDDHDLQQLIPIPSQDKFHALSTNMQKMREGKRDFDVFCILWSKSKPPQGKATKKGKTQEYELPRAGGKFDISFFPRVVQDAFSKVTSSMHALVEERKRAEAEKKRLADIEDKKKEAIAAAAKKLAEEQKAAKVSAMALIAVAQVVTDQAGGRATRSNSSSSSSSSSSDTARAAVCNFCYCSAFFWGCFWFGVFFFLSLFCFFSLYCGACRPRRPK